MAVSTYQLLERHIAAPRALTRSARRRDTSAGSRQPGRVLVRRLPSPAHLVAEVTPVRPRWRHLRCMFAAPSPQPSTARDGAALTAHREYLKALARITEGGK